MRLTIIVLVMILLSFFITTYTAAESPKEIELSNGEVVKVFFEKHTNGYRYEVRFENGHYYFYQMSGNMGHGGGPMELTNKEIDLAQEAIDRYEQLYGNATKSKSSGNPVGFLIILIGLFGAIFPHAAWYLEIGWKLQDAEPSELALLVNRIAGIVISIIGLFILI